MPTFDNATGGSGLTAGDGSFTLSHTVSGSDRWLVAHAHMDSGSATISGMTYNGVSMTQIVDFGANTRVFVLTNPATGTNDLVMSSDTGGTDVAIYASSYTDVDQTTPYDGLTSTALASGNTSVTVSSATGDLVAGGITSADAGGAPTHTVGADQTQRVQQSGGRATLTQSDEAGASSVTHSYSVTADGFGSGTWGLSLNPAPTGVTVSLGTVAFDLASQTLTPSTQGVSVSLGTVAFGMDLGSGLGVQHTLQPVTFNFSPQTVTVAGVVNADLGVVTFGFAPQDFTWVQDRALGTVEFSLSPTILTPPLSDSALAGRSNGFRVGISIGL